MKNKHVIIIISTMLVLLTSCSKWLEVQPSDRVTEEQAFSSLQSFKKALNGIYIELNNKEVYGKALSCEFVDILAQYYAISPAAVGNTELLHFNYTASGNLGRISAIWASMYNLIANTNHVIKNSDLQRAVLPDDYYGLIKGEALALRAMLHFDLFRLFGPVYSQGSDRPGIPYYDEFTLDVKLAPIAKDYMAYVIRDLEAAAALLEKDPIRTKGPDGDASDVFKQYRTLRLNYYAVKALLARVYLYAGEHGLALTAAKEVMAVQSRWFPWIRPENVLEDRVFSTELLFSLQNIGRRELFTSLFDNRNLEAVNALSPKEYVVLKIFDYQRHDYRYMANLQQAVLVGADTYRMFSKYEIGNDSLKNQLIPMIRMSEVFYIAAEAETDKKEGMKHLNVVRNNRGIASSSTDWYFFDDRLKTEYIREFWGEGQLFYFYKRKNIRTVQSALDEWEQVEVKEKDYTLPLPEGETKYN